MTQDAQRYIFSPERINSSISSTGSNQMHQRGNEDQHVSIPDSNILSHPPSDWNQDSHYSNTVRVFPLPVDGSAYPLPQQQTLTELTTSRTTTPTILHYASYLVIEHSRATSESGNLNQPWYPNNEGSAYPLISPYAEPPSFVISYNPCGPLYNQSNPQDEARLVQQQVPWVPLNTN
jgi:hypothetical protein